MKLFITLTFCILSLFACNSGIQSIDEWNKDILNKDNSLINIAVKEQDNFYISINKASNGYYAVFNKYLNEGKRSQGLGTWVETYHKNKKVILKNGYEKSGGQYFLQDENFDAIHFCYKFDNKDEKAIIFPITQTEQTPLTMTGR